MSSDNDGRSRHEPTSITRPRGRRLPLGTVVRVVLLAALGALGAAWGLAHHYTSDLPPMRVPVQPSSAPTYDADGGELPVPDLEPSP